MTRRAGPLLCAALALTPTPARGQGVPAAAREHFARGVAAADGGRLEAAMVEFTRVWELTRDPFVLFNIAVTHEALGRDGAALDAMERYERESPQLAPARRTAVDVALRRLRARVATLALRLSAEGARVHVDDALVTPEAARAGVRLPVGVHRVEIAAPGHHAYETTIELAGGDRVVLDARLDPVRAPLAVDCEVPDAEVLVDGEAVGETPMATATLVAEGLHRVEVRRAGYVPFSTAVEVRGGGQRVRVELPWAARDPSNSARLVVHTRPADAVLRLDGRVLDAADGELVPPGAHRLRVERVSYVPLERDVSLRAGETLRLDLTPAPTAALRAAWRDARGARRVRAVALLASGAALALGAGLVVGVAATDLSEADARLRSYYDCAAHERLLVCQARAGSSERAMIDDFTDARAWTIAGSIAAGVGLGLLALGVQQMLGDNAEPRIVARADGVAVRW